MYVCTYVRTYVCMYVCMHVCVYVCTNDVRFSKCSCCTLLCTTHSYFFAVGLRKPDSKRLFRFCVITFVLRILDSERSAYLVSGPDLSRYNQPAPIDPQCSFCERHRGYAEHLGADKHWRALYPDFTGEGVCIRACSC